MKHVNCALYSKSTTNIYGLIGQKVYISKKHLTWNVEFVLLYIHIYIYVCV